MSIDASLSVTDKCALCTMTASDLFSYNKTYRVLICQSCAIGIVPRYLVSHIYRHHRDRPWGSPLRSAIQHWVDQDLLPNLPFGLVDPYLQPFDLPGPEQEALAGLRVQNGYGCNYCDYVTKGDDSMMQHYNTQHAPKRRGRGGAKACAKGVLKERLDFEHFGAQPAWKPVQYQRLFQIGPTRATRNFRVKVTESVPTRQAMTSAFNSHQSIEEQVLQHLETLDAQQSRQHIATSDAATCQVSPWLERTRWPQYLDGHKFCDVVRLLYPETGSSATALPTILCSIDRLIELAYESICADKVNFFGQKRITSFLPHREAYSRPLVFKLQKGTYRQYKQIWSKAITFVHQTSIPGSSVQLRHRLNGKQTALFDTLLNQASDDRVDEPLRTRALDRTCLDFCIALLEERLNGDLYSNAIVAFFAVLGIDEPHQTFHDAVNFTPQLSGFIKIAQLLVLQKAVFAAEDGAASDPLEALDEMRCRFMTLDQNTPFTWALSLRAFGKRIRDCTTSLGVIRWSEDSHTLYYRSIELHIDAFRDFVAQQVYKAQNHLDLLFLLRDHERQEEAVPKIALDLLRDNPAIVKNGCSFLNDERNKKVLPSEPRWLLRRVLQTPVLRDQFCRLDTMSRIVWQQDRIDKYLAKVDAFLESLLLLVHITSGQPARRTEITSLQHSNSTFHRNVFIEDGLVALVTSYHKGYTCTGTTKIIHQYLPKEVSELFVYYRALILPFVQEVSALRAGNLVQRPSDFLWPNGDSVWSSQRLSDILQRETGTTFVVLLTIATYRHIAIALSRRHLQHGGFKRDYYVEEQYGDHQTTHTSWTAGRLYARGLDEAPGHVESRRAGYREVSRQWHTFLGFSQPKVTIKRPLEDITNDVINKRSRANSQTQNTKAKVGGVGPRDSFNFS